MKLVTRSVIKCPECTVLFQPDESHSVFVVGDCPSCGKNIRGERISIVVDIQHEKP